MSETDDRIAVHASSQHGIFTRAQAKAAGASDHACDYRLACGRWLRVHRGVYRMAGAPATWLGDVVAACMAAGGHAAASHRTAAVLWAFDGFDRDVVEIVVPVTRAPAPAGVVVHRVRHLTVRDVTTLGPIRVTTPLRTLLDMSSVVGVDRLESMVEEALRREMVGLDRLRRAARSPAHRARPGVGRLRHVLEARGGVPATGSDLETDLVKLLRLAGLPAPTRQHPIRLGARSYLIDFAYPTLKIAIEVDGYRYHSGRSRFERDLTRHNDLVGAGWHTLRLTDRAIRRRGEATVARVRALVSERIAALEARGA